MATVAMRVDHCVPAPATPCQPPGLLIAILLKLKPSAAVIVIGLAILNVIVQPIDTYLVRDAFQKERIEKFLDEIVRAQFKGAARDNRLTLFKKTNGLFARFIAWRRARQREDEDDRRRKLAAVSTVKWRPKYKYLYVYARASRAPNPKSSVVWRVYKDGESEGMAGKAWDSGEVVTARDLPKFAPAALDAV